jgi:hypothetical protein
MAEANRLDYIPVTFTLGAAGVDSATRLGTGQKWLNGPLTLVGPRAEIQGPGGAYLRSTGTDASDALIELRLNGAVDDSKLQLTQTTLTLEGGTAVNITANDGGDVTIGSRTIVASDTDPSSPSSTTHAFQVGTPGTTSGDYQLKIGPRQIMATEGDLTSNLELNQDGGAVLIRGRQVAPVLDISGVLAGSGASETSTTQGFVWQAGRDTVSFSTGVGALTFPTAFPNGVIAFVANLAVTGVGTLAYTTVTASTANLWAATSASGAAPVALNTSANVSWIAIGW